MELFISIIEQGFIYGIAALGAYISYKILDFPDLSVEGTFPLGAAVSAYLIVGGYNPYLACLAAMIFGAIAGVCTGLIHVKLKVTDLQSGIIMLTGLYSVNLIINGKANVPFFDMDTIFSFQFPSVVEQLIQGAWKKAIIAGIIFIIAKVLLDIYLKTKSGFLLRASGDNAQYVTLLGKDAGSMKILGLSIANALAALSGAIACQYQRFFDVSMGTGVIVIALSSVIIGISIFKRLSMIKVTTMALLGCMVFRTCYAIAISMGIDSKYMKIMTALLFLVSLVVSDTKSKRKKVA